MNAENHEAKAESVSAFQRLLAIGLSAWFLTQVAVIAVGLLGKPGGGLISAVNGAIDNSWIGYLVGLAAILGLAFRFRGGLRFALVAYVAPSALYAIICAVFYSIYQDPIFLSELVGILPLLWLFGLIGWLWLRLRPTSGGDALAHALLPPLISGVAILLWVGIPTFRSDEFVYRDAFRIDLKKTTFAGSELAMEAVLEIRKPGDYQYRATKYSHLDMMNEESSTMDHLTGRIEWANASPQTAIGTYPLTIRWEKSSPPPTAAEDPMGEDCIVFAVSKADAPETVIKTITLPLRAE